MTLLALVSLDVVSDISLLRTDTDVVAGNGRYCCGLCRDINASLEDWGCIILDGKRYTIFPRELCIGINSVNKY